LRSERYLSLLDRLDAGTSQPRFYVSPQSTEAGGREVEPTDLARRALPRLLGPHWRKLRRRVRKAGSTPSDAQLHRIRIASKQLRYGAELAEPVLGKTARRTARRAEDIQTILGDHHDSVTAVEWLEQIPADSTTGASFVAGGKATDARRRQLESRQQWEHAWDRLNSGTVTDWLR
jgi:CHAD domain-containing protein